MTSLAVTKACQGCSSCSAASVNSPAWYFHHKYTQANFIGHSWSKISIKIIFYSSRKHISLIWVGFFKQSMGILWLLYQVFNVIKWFLGLNNWNGPSLPSRFGLVKTTSICTQPPVKSRKIPRNQFFLNFSTLAPSNNCF